MSKSIIDTISRYLVDISTSNEKPPKGFSLNKEQAIEVLELLLDHINKGDKTGLEKALSLAKRDNFAAAARLINSDLLLMSVKLSCGWGIPEQCHGSTIDELKTIAQRMGNNPEGVFYMSVGNAYTAMITDWR